MKRYIKLIGFLMLMFVVYASGAYVVQDMTPKPPPPPGPTPVYNPKEDGPQASDLGLPKVIEYGHQMVIKHNNDPLHAYISYPQANNPADEAIYDWATGLFNDMAANYNTAAELGPADFGEINVHFDSYLIDNRYAGILQIGEYSRTTTEPSQEIVKTFNIDVTGFKHLEPKDIINLEGAADDIISLLHIRLLVEHPRTDGYLTFIDESWFTNLIITHEGIVVILPQYEFLPDDFKTLTVTLPYEDLGSSLLIRKGAPLPSMPTPTPSPTPDPTPTPTPTTDPDGDGDGTGVDPDGDGDPTGSDPDEETPPPPTTVPPQSGSIDPSRPVIALSFDDGPGIYTNDFLNLLEQYNIRVTFCTIGNLVNTQATALKRAVELGNEIIGHSWDHKNLAKLNAEDVKQQIESTRDAIEAVTGLAVPMFRPPYGAVSDTMKTVSAELGYAMINWNVDPEDWNTKDVDKVYDAVMAQVKDRAIILSHEIYHSTLEAYKRLIPELLSQGYQIVTVSELLKLKYNDLTPGNIYYNG
ncbi:MAG: polysaccharide deacetylase family protein [Oscillospiraceae bacterium]|nr:polysaccharide deacetylase family protein [Oscillospiraceae bacterium]